MKIYFIGGKADKTTIEEDEMKNPNYEKRYFILNDGKKYAFFVYKEMSDHQAKERAEIYIQI
ncbi:hypothetical protein ROR68_03605 [Acinetobacter baumannii]|uniref:hypothetical protein n=1 Tax=Acinetobacter baumannii TaxID=470 RepID=UPI00044D7CB3|nr:hypothetical protein [Acinetobacter baumannii]EKV6300211.1 hypothetical protein [Acinetobacter baumannii]EXH48594.1 hypothetical protein J605_2338 [Acinetobacter baumannii 1412924]MCA4182755.1 hypothetical protein [Acinetobacter baumannii]MDC4360995.1 hypothetical protein [Acinetobacter baumannii]MDC4953538.1 hypothetical protein [Acinetobacter baumannii]